MEEKNFKELVRRIEEVNSIIKKLDPSIREQAFSLFMPYLKGGKTVISEEGELPNETDFADDSAEKFFSKHNHDKPADNAILLSAYYYSKYGTEAFSLDEIRKLSNAVGVTIPSRIDMTYSTSQRDGKTLFTRSGKGKFRPTVHGEAFFKKTYSVSKGRK